MRRICLALAGVGALAVGFTLSTASPCRAHGMGGPLGGFVDDDGDGISDRKAALHVLGGRHGGLNLSGLALTADQQASVDKLKTDHQAAASALLGDLQTKETELKDLMKATTRDQAAIDAKVTEITGLRSQLEAGRDSYVSSVIGVLTAEQRGTLEAQRIGLTRGGVTLTAEQLAQLDQLTSGHQTSTSAVQSSLQAKQTELRDLIRATTPDQAAINAKIDEISTLQAQLQKENAGYQIAVRGLLTPEQQAALDAARPPAPAGLGPGGRGHGRGPMGHGRR